MPEPVNDVVKKEKQALVRPHLSAGRIQDHMHNQWLSMAKAVYDGVKNIISIICHVHTCYPIWQDSRLDGA